MKKINIFIFVMALGSLTFAQKFVPQIKANTVINYTITQNGQALPYTLTFTSFGSPIKIDWVIDGYGTGNFEMSAKALESGKASASASPTPDELTKLPSFKTVACISKAAFADLIKNQAFEYDDLKFSVTKDDASAVIIGGKTLDVFHAVALNGKGELWVLNNPDFPLICRTKDSVQGTDLNLTDIK